MSASSIDYNVTVGSSRANIIALDSDNETFTLTVQPPQLPAGVHKTTMSVRRMGVALFNNSQQQDTIYWVRWADGCASGW
jgi:hypothetical protein